LYDIIVSGAGPAGSYSAYLCAKSGLRTLLLERSILPRKKCCAGGVLERAVRLLDLDLHANVIERELNGFHFVREGRYYRNAKAVEQRLNKSWPDHTGQKYDKSAPRIYNMISGLTDQAIQNAQWVREEHHKDKKNPLDCNSSTEVYRVVKFLLGWD
jgi:choline dehydrogenase-like flavoprotein